MVERCLPGNCILCHERVLVDKLSPNGRQTGKQGKVRKFPIPVEDGNRYRVTFDLRVLNSMYYCPEPQTWLLPHELLKGRHMVLTPKQTQRTVWDITSEWDPRNMV